MDTPLRRCVYAARSDDYARSMRVIFDYGYSYL